MPRPKKEPTVFITVPVNKIALVSEILGKPVAENQTPVVSVRAPKSMVQAIREKLKG